LEGASLLRAFIYYCLFYSWTLIALLIALPLSLISADWIHRCGIIWGRVCLALAGLKLDVRGQENIPDNTLAIYVVNHQSNFDIPILYAGLPLQFRWMAKAELFRVPLFGLAMKRCGYIPIDRSNRRQAIHSINLAAERIQAGTSVIVFPEGTRTTDGQLQAFKKGALLIAAKARVPVVPMAINGSFAIQPKGSWKVGKGPLRLSIMPPIATADLQIREVEALTEKVHSLIAADLAEEVTNDN
jgi:1-acyl-sn-glycerol-3-phosphate acyltransferase